MESEYKYKRWAWGALIGLAAVIIIAGIVMAMTLSHPEPNKEVATTVNQAEEPKSEETTEKPAGNDTTTENDTQAETKPETTTENTQSASSTEQSNSGSVEAPTTTTTTTTETNNIPKTGPEDMILPIFALAVCGSLFAYNVVLFKKNA